MKERKVVKERNTDQHHEVVRMIEVDQSIKVKVKEEVFQGVDATHHNLRMAVRGRNQKSLVNIKTEIEVDPGSIKNTRQTMKNDIKRKRRKVKSQDRVLGLDVREIRFLKRIVCVFQKKKQKNKFNYILFNFFCNFYKAASTSFSLYGFFTFCSFFP